MYHLTGSWRVTSPGDYHIAGTDFHYGRPYNRPEFFTALGPLNQDVIVEVQNIFIYHTENIVEPLAKTTSELGPPESVSNDAFSYK